MRTPWLGDAAALARVLLDVAPERRGWVLHRMIGESRRAAGYLRARGRVHPVWGTGSILAVALRRAPRSEPSLADPVFRSCLIMVLEALACDHRDRR